MFTVSVSQGQLFDRSIQSIPQISVCKILPNDSLVFSLVQKGQLNEFRLLLDQGKASLRDHDEQGMSLLHVRARLLLPRSIFPMLTSNIVRGHRKCGNVQVSH